ncbi:hypothetical protein DFS34DRAFT_256907 [Phlyctochytrium arcticum]|nr:hypothetical protein DFS34DRAFT_256907 [Phlyctochytrium arcticum]
MVRNQIRGPSSALSSFLRERGIRAPVNTWRRNTDTTTPTENGETTVLDNSGSTTTAAEVGPDAEVESPVGGSSENTPQAQSEVAETDAVQAEVAEVVAPIKGKGKRKAATKKKASKKSKDSDSDSDFGQPLPGHNRSAHSKKRKLDGNHDKEGVVCFCDRCQRRFIVAEAGQTLCLACFSIQSKTSSTTRTPKKRKVTLNLDGEPIIGISSLRNLCIKLIANYIDEVEGFGEISEATKHSIGKIISRHRMLNGENLRLFLGPSERSVRLSECTYLNEEHLRTIIRECPNLEVLSLGNCGRITDNVLADIGGLGSLQSLNLLGPFLPSDQAFADMFTRLGDNLKSLSLQYAAKVSAKSMSALAQHCPNITALRLDQCLKLGDESVQSLCELRQLRSLELNRLGENVSSDCLIRLLQSVGEKLDNLTLNGHPFVDDALLNDVLAPMCPDLEHISLEDCPAITSDGLIKFFSSYKPTKPLKTLNLFRNTSLNDDAIVSILNLHGSGLESLNLNGLDELKVYSLEQIAKLAPSLKVLDVSWIRNMNDTILEEILVKCCNLERVKVYGCNRLSECVANRQWVNRAGVGIRVVGNEFC